MPEIVELEAKVTDLEGQVVTLTAASTAATESVTTLTGERDTAVSSLDIANKTVADLTEANSKFSAQAASLTEKATGFDALQEEVKTLRDNATGHMTELAKRDADIKSVTDTHMTMRRGHISSRNGIELSKLVDLTSAQLDAIELTSPIVKSNENGKGLGMGSGGGTGDISTMSEKDRALSVIEALKKTA
jgi:chromosome segregation ATPase